MLAREFFRQQLTKAGQNPDAPEFQPYFQAMGAELNLPDELINPVNSGLLSIDQARNNHPDIRKHYTSQVYNGLDNELNQFLQEENLDETTMQEINAEKSSTKRAVLIAKKLRQLTEQKSTTNSKGEKDVLQTQIVELNNQLRTLKEQAATKDAAHAQQLLQQQVDFKKGHLMKDYKTIYDHMDPSTRDAVIDVVITKHLKSRNAKLTADPNTGELIVTDNDGNNVFSPTDNRPFTAKGFIDMVLGQEKIIVVNDTNNGNGNSNNNNGSGNGQHSTNGQNRQHFNNNQNSNQNNNQNRNFNNGNGGGNGNGNGGGNRNALLSLVQEGLNNLNNSSAGAGV